MEHRYAVFLDIDGVFTSQRVHIAEDNEWDAMWGKFDVTAVEFMNRLDREYAIDWVLMSTWKNGIDVEDITAYLFVTCMFRTAGFRGLLPLNRWKTEDDVSSGDNRPGGVKKYLEDYPYYEDFLLFDDSFYRFDEVLGKKRFVKTSPQDGLLSDHMRKALSITGEWKRR